jgi:hypothetical protein
MCVERRLEFLFRPLYYTKWTGTLFRVFAYLLDEKRKMNKERESKSFHQLFRAGQAEKFVGRNASSGL